jgi:hypothetical protein
MVYGYRFSHIKVALPCGNPLALCRLSFLRRKSHRNAGHQKECGRTLKVCLGVLSLSFGCQISSHITVVVTSTRTSRTTTLETTSIHREEIGNHEDTVSGTCTFLKGKARMKESMKGSQDGEMEAQDGGRKEMGTRALIHLHYQLRKIRQSILHLSLLHPPILPLISPQLIFLSKTGTPPSLLGLMHPEHSTLQCLDRKGSTRMALSGLLQTVMGRVVVLQGQ